MRRTIAWIAAGLAVILVAVGVYAGVTYFNFIGGVNRVSGVVGNSTPGTAQNILLVGSDQRPAGMTAKEFAELSTTDDGGSSNTDTMILLHIPANGSSATLVSLPRDAYVSIPGFGQNKLNAAYVDGSNARNGTAAQDDAAGMKLLISTVQDFTGLTINHYVKVNLLSFYNIVNVLGPVTVCLNEAVDDPYSGAHFPKGVQQLDATQALQFVRQRHGLPNGDLDREVRQQYFLSVEAQQVLSAGTLLNPVKLNKVVRAVGSNLEADSSLNFISLATQMKSLKGGGIHSATIPLMSDPYGEVAGVGDVVELDFGAIPAFFDQIMGKPTPAQQVAKATAAAPSSVTVDVLNGAGTASGSSTALATYQSLGFKVGQPSDAPSTQATTTIYYPAGETAQAKAVLKYLPGATVATSTQYKTVTVVLGTDGQMPSATPASTPSSGSGGSSGSSGSGGSSAAASPSATPSSPTTNYTKTRCVN